VISTYLQEIRRGIANQYDIGRCCHLLLPTLLFVDHLEKKRCMHTLMFSCIVLWCVEYQLSEVWSSAGIESQRKRKRRTHYSRCRRGDNLTASILCPSLTLVFFGFLVRSSRPFCSYTLFRSFNIERAPIHHGYTTRSMHQLVRFVTMMLTTLVAGVSARRI
jgi:hypothetical protein